MVWSVLFTNLNSADARNTTLSSVNDVVKMAVIHAFSYKLFISWQDSVAYGYHLLSKKSELDDREDIYVGPAWLRQRK